MSESESGGRKPHKDYGIHTNQVDILGRVVAPAQDTGKMIKVPILVPTWKKGGGRQWIPLTIDVFDDEAKKVAKPAKASDLFRCTCFMVDRQVQTTGGENRNLKVLQLDAYREVALMAMPALPNPEEPPMDGLCYSRVLLAGRLFLRKDEMKDGNDTPTLVDEDGKKHCYAKVKYEDPFQEVKEGEWPKATFFDLRLNGAQAEIVSQFCRNRAQVLVRGELSKYEVKWEVTNKATGAPQKPKEIRVSVIPGGFAFMNVGQGGGTQKQPQSPQTYDENDDLPF